MVSAFKHVISPGHVTSVPDELCSADQSTGAGSLSQLHGAPPRRQLLLSSRTLGWSCAVWTFRGEE